jgi:hypothetical protein
MPIQVKQHSIDFVHPSLASAYAITKVEDQVNGKCHFIDGIELIQYFIINTPTVMIRERMTG